MYKDNATAIFDETRLCGGLVMRGHGTNRKTRKNKEKPKQTLAFSAAAKETRIKATTKRVAFIGRESETQK
jgi:hypothetical protein